MLVRRFGWPFTVRQKSTLREFRRLLPTLTETLLGNNRFDCEHKVAEVAS